MEHKTCFHCGLESSKSGITYDKKSFCCNGCKTVYEIFSVNELSCYYDLQDAPGTTPKEIKGKYDFLNNEKITEKLFEFNDGPVRIVSLFIPNIHCSSCIWILENLNKLLPEISSSLVNFGEKSVRITFNGDQISIKDLVKLLCRIGYEPYISLENYEPQKIKLTAH